MKKSIPILLLFLTACSNSSEPVHTVSEFRADEKLLTETIAACRENPGELSGTPNCKNAEEADGRARLERMKNALGG